MFVTKFDKGGRKMEVGMVFLVILSFVLIGFGIYGYNKREALYAEYAEYFGPVKAWFFITCTVSGTWAAICGILSLFVESINPEITGLIVGLVFLAIGVLIGFLAQKKANENGDGNVIWPMFVAGFGTFWKIEWTIFKFVCFYWIIDYIIHRED